MIKKELYAAPETEVLELHLEGNVLQNVSNTTDATLGDTTLGVWE